MYYCFVSAKILTKLLKGKTSVYADKMIGECTQLTKNFSEYAEIQIGNIPSRTTVDKVQKSTIIKMENLREAGHVQRANNTRTTKKLFEAKPEGQKLGENPKKHWSH